MGKVSVTVATSTARTVIYHDDPVFHHFLAIVRIFRAQAVKKANAWAKSHALDATHPVAAVNCISGF